MSWCRARLFSESSLIEWAWSKSVMAMGEHEGRIHATIIAERTSAAGSLAPPPFQGRRLGGEVLHVRAGGRCGGTPRGAVSTASEIGEGLGDKEEQRIYCHESP